MQLLEINRVNVTLKGLLEEALNDGMAVLDFITDIDATNSEHLEFIISELKSLHERGVCTEYLEPNFHILQFMRERFGLSCAGNGNFNAARLIIKKL